MRLFSTSSASTELKPREFRNLRPIPCTGVYKSATNAAATASSLIPGNQTSNFCVAVVSTPCFFLGPEKMTVQQRGVMPVPIREDFEPALVAAMKTSVDQRANVYKSWSGQVITDRNNALFDSLTATFACCDSPYHGIVQALEKFADLKVCGLLAEVKCTIDELMGIAFATSLPVVIASSLYESSCMDGLLEQRKWGELESSERMHLTSPYFNSKEEARLWRQEQERQLQQIERSRQLGQGRRSRTVADISDATTFLKLSNIEKRAILRASGLTQLPRPREGARAVDALIIPLLDEEVAYEVLRRLAETKGNFKEASEMVDFESKKPKIARQIMEARKRGDFESAKNLCEELNSLSLLRFDPTNPEGAGGEWDTVLYGFG
eukprot:gene31847-41327_t